MTFYMGFLVVSVVVVAGIWSLAVDSWFPAPPKSEPAEVAVAQVEGDEEAVRPYDLDLSLRELQILPLMSILGAYIFVVFGFLSRRCERQADIFGCRAVSCTDSGCLTHGPAVTLAPAGNRLCRSGIRTFIGALEKVASINGINRNRPGMLQSWQHSTIARRVDFLQRLLDDPTLEVRFQRTVAAVKWAVVLALVAMLLTLGQVQGWENLGLF
jgi:hypothetical protein